MNDINAWLAAAGFLVLAWNAFSLIGSWWSRRRRLRLDCGKVYMRASEPLIRGQLVVHDGNGGVRPARSFVVTDTSGLRVNPTPDGDTDEGT